MNKQPLKFNGEAKPFRTDSANQTGRQLYPLEQRMLFDGAGMATADTIVSDTGDEAPIVESDQSTAALPVLPQASSRQLLLIDSSVQDWALIAQHASPDMEVVLLNDDEAGIDQLLRAVRGEQPVAAVHIVSHGSEGRVSFGAEALSIESIDSQREQLISLGAQMTADADILLYGCDVGSDAAGVEFLAALAHVTGADVNASDDLTGHAELGGDWELEVSTGRIEADLALSDAGQSAWLHLLDPVPSVVLSAPAEPVMIGGDFTVQATFDNTAVADPGYAPYIDLFVPVQGVDGAGSPDGLNVSGATYLGAALAQTEVTLTAADIVNGTVAHPYFVDSVGNSAVTIPAGLVAGDQLIVFELPFGSYTAGQPSADIQISGSVSALADLNTDLNLVARAGFRYGQDALDNPSTDPAIQGAEYTIAITPTLYQIRTTYIGPEHETASGPNYLRAYRLDVDIADGQQLDSLNLASILPDGMNFQAIVGQPTAIGGESIGVSPSGTWINVNGVLVSSPASEPGSPGPGRQPIVRDFGSMTGTSGSTDVSMVVQFYVPEFYDDGSTVVLDPVSGDSVSLVHGTSISASWDPLDSRDAIVGVSDTVTSSHVLEVEALAIQKGRTIDSDVGVAGISPGDRLQYRLNLQVSDYFAVGGNSSSSGSSDQFLITDTLSDGLTLLDSTTAPSSVDPTLVVSRSGGASDSYTLVRGTHYTVNQLAGGQEQVVFDLRSTVVAGNGQMLIGDLFDADNTSDGATTAVLLFDASVLESYRVAPPDAAGDPLAGSAQGNLNEADYLVNNAVVSSTVLNATLNPDDPSAQSEGDDTRVSDQIEANTVGIAIVGRNGAAVTNSASSPIRIAPGDDVTYRITYTVPTGDFEDFSLDAFLPLPIFNAADPDSDGTPSGWNAAGAFTTAPTVGEYALRVTGGDGSGVVVPTPSVLSANGLSFDFGNREDLSNDPLDIEVFFTVRASNDPFADGLFLSALAQQSGTSTGNAPLATQSIDRLQLTEPAVDIVKGAVQDDVNTATSAYDPAYTGAAPESLFNPAGDTGANPLTGVMTAGDVAGLDADISQVDAGDKIRFAIAVTNTGSSAAGAFDVRFRDTLPANMDAASLENLRVVLGDGTVLDITNDLRVSGGGVIASEADAFAALFGAGLELVDPEESAVGAGAALVGTTDSAGSPTTPGANVLVVTYDATVAASALADSTEASLASLTSYAGSEAGPDHVAEDKTDAARVTTPLPQIDKRIVGTDQAFTPDDNGAAPRRGDVVVGEVITYEVTLQVPEGTLTNAMFIDVLDANRLGFADLISASSSAGVSFDSGEVFVSQVPGDSGGPSNRLAFNLGTVTNTNTDNSTADTITLTYSAVVLNTSATNTGVAVNNTARLQHSGTDVSASAPNMRIVEPAVDVQISASTSSVDAGDTVTYTVTVTSHGGSAAFDVALNHAIASGMTYVPGSLSSVSGGGSPAESGGVITAGWSDIATGGSAQFTYQAQVDSSVSIADSLSSPVNVDWSSLPGVGNHDHSVFISGIDDTERTGSSGVNDHLDADAAPVNVTVMTPVMTLINTSEITSSSSQVVPGEVVRYRMVTQVPEANATDFQMRPALPAGLRYVNDGSATVGFIANGGGNGVDSSTLTGASLDLNGGGLTAADVTGLTPVLALPGGAITDTAGAAIAANAVAASGAEPVFRLGDLTNDDSDSDREFVVIEFNAVVENEVLNSTGQLLPATFSVFSAGVSRGSSAAESITVGEPLIDDVEKRVLDVTGDQVTFEVTWTNSGNEDAHNVRLSDSFVGAANISFNQAVNLTSVPVGTTDNSTATALDVALPVIAPGESVTVRYTATITDPLAVVPARDATVEYTSLSSSGVSLTTSVEDSAANPSTVITTSTGERTGSAGDYGGAVNDYRDVDPAAIGVISGRLWDDTLNYESNYDSGVENPLAGVPVSMRYAGANGIFDDGDDAVLTATTTADGSYSFTAALAGNYRIDAPSTLTDPTSGPVALYLERTATGLVDGRSEFAVTEGEDSNNHDFGFVKINDQPTISQPADQTVNEDSTLTLAGTNRIQIDDPDRLEGANPVVAPANYRTTLTVSDGVINVTPTAGAAVTGNNSTSIVMVGTISAINATLDGLTYQGNQNFNGVDSLVVTVDDRGNSGDADGDLVPGEVADDNLSASSSIGLTVLPMPDDPVANPDARTINEDTTATGQALAPNATQVNDGDRADTDPDAGNGDTRTVVGVQVGNVTGPVAGSVNAPVAGTHGSLQIAADGQWTYVPGAAAQALQLGDTVNDVFTYTIADSTGRTATTTVTITLNGANDTPLANPDTNSAPGDASTSAQGNAIIAVAANDQADTDADSTDSLTVTGVMAGSGAGPVGGSVGVPIAGSHGSLTLEANGDYSYTADNTNPAVLALRHGQTLSDVFSYTVDDGNGGQATSTITIVVTGVENPPSSQDQSFTISEDLAIENGQPLAFSLVDFVFADIDSGDSLSGVRLDSLPASGELRLNGAPVTQAQVIAPGQLDLLSYTPAKHANNQNLGGPVVFDFSVIDSTGQASQASNQISIDITPVNDPPVAPVITRLIDADARSGSDLARIADIAVPSDLDRPAQTLTTTVTALPPAENGRFELDGVPVGIGQVLTDAQLQRLHFVPAPTLATAPDAQGNRPAGSLVYEVVDGHGGTATGAINIDVRPNNAILPPSVGLTGSRGIGATNSFGQPVSRAERLSGVDRSAEALDPITPPEDAGRLYANGLPPEPKGEYTTNYAIRAGVEHAPGVYLEPAEFDWGQTYEDDFDMMSSLARVRPYETLQDQLDRQARERALKAAAQAPVDDGCEPEKPKVKPKPKVVKRSVLGAMAGEKPKRFSEAIERERPKAKPRLKIKPRQMPIC